MANYGLLVDAQWCSGCHSCEIACQMEHGLPVGETGVKVVKIGPWAIGPEKDENWQFSYLPIPTKQCDTCAMRRGAGKVPTCVQHCQSQCLEFGTVEELSAKIDEKQKDALRDQVTCSPCGSRRPLPFRRGRRRAGVAWPIPFPGGFSVGIKRKGMDVFELADGQSMRRMSRRSRPPFWRARS